MSKNSKSDEAQRKPVPLWEVHGISQQECYDAIAVSNHEMRQLGFAELRIDQARHLLGLLEDAGIDNGDLSNRAIFVLDRVRNLLNTAVKKLHKYDREQTSRYLENFAQGGAS